MTPREKEISALADNIRRQYGNDGYPVDPVVIACNIGLNVYVADLGSEVSGQIFYNKKQILIAKKDPLVRKVFSVAHEIGHYYLHNDGTSHTSKRDIVSSWGIDNKEVEANHFAASLLVPEEEILNIAQRIDKEFRITTIDALADYFNVSTLTMEFRLKKLKINNINIYN